MTIPFKWLVIAVVAVAGIVLVIAIVSRDAGQEYASATAEPTSQDLLVELGCPAAEENYSSSVNVAASYNCDPDASQEYVYFFDTPGDQQAWNSRILSLNDNTSVVVGNGWALRTFSPARLADALNIDGASQLR